MREWDEFEVQLSNDRCLLLRGKFIPAFSGTELYTPHPADFQVFSIKVEHHLNHTAPVELLDLCLSGHVLIKGMHDYIQQAIKFFEAKGVKA